MINETANPFHAIDTDRQRIDALEREVHHLRRLVDLLIDIRHYEVEERRKAREKETPSQKAASAATTSQAGCSNQEKIGPAS